MNGYIARNSGFERDLREGFARQSLMGSIGARLEKIAPGEVDIALESRPDILQQNENETLVATMLGTMMTRSR